MNKNKWSMIVVIIAVGVTFIGAAPAGAVDKILCGSTGTASSHYTYTVSAGKAINSVVGDKINVTVVATGGAVDNLERINRGQMPMGIGTWATFYQAYKGIGKYKNDARPKYAPYGSIRLMPRTMWSGRTPVLRPWRI